MHRSTDGRPCRGLLAPLLLGALLTFAAGPAMSPALAQNAVSAEPWFRRGTVMLTALAGGAAFTDFQRNTATPLTPQVGLEHIRRRVSARTTGHVGASAGVWLGQSWGMRAGVAYAPSHFTVDNGDEAERVMAPNAIMDGRQYAGLGVLTADVSILFRPPIAIGRVVPYGIVGAGLVHYWKRDNGELPPEARTRFASGSWTAPAAVAGVGAAIPLQMSNLMLTFELTNHITRTPLDDRGAGEEFELNGVALRIEPDDVRSDTDGVGRTSNVRLSVGLTLPIR